MNCNIYGCVTPKENRNGRSLQRDGKDRFWVIFAHCALQPSLLGRRVVQNYIYVLSIKRKDRDKLWHCSTAKGIRAHFQTSQGEKFKWFNTWEETGLVVTNSVLLNYWKTIGKTTGDKQNVVDCVVLGSFGGRKRTRNAQWQRQFAYNFTPI